MGSEVTPGGESPRRIVHLTTVHKPLDVRIFEKECRSLSEAGYEVHLLATDPPSTEKEGVHLHPISRRSGRRSGFRTLRECFARTRSLRPDLVHFHDPGLIPLGLALRALGFTVVYDAHEDAPTEARTLFRDRRTEALVRSALLRLLEALASRALAGFVCATPTIGEKFPADRTVVVPNYPLAREFSQEPRRTEPTGNDRPKLLYTGGIFPSRGLFQMLDTVAALPESVGAELRLFGDFASAELLDEATRHSGWERTHYGGWLDRAGIAEELSRADVGLVLLHPEPAFEASLPVKMFEYMAAAIPVVASDFPIWRKIVETSGCGLLVDPLDQKECVEAVTWLLEHPDEARAMGRRGRRAVLEEYNWDSAVEALLRLYESLLE